jgi:hypothetical protein
MSKYIVLKPIEWGVGPDTKMYFPPDYWGVDKITKKALPPPSKTVPSGCNGRDIPIDFSGFIELPDEIAQQLNLGQIATLDGEPNREGYHVLSRALSAEQERRGTEDRVEDSSGKERWVAGAPREVTPLSTSGTMRVAG